MRFKLIIILAIVFASTSVYAETYIGRFQDGTYEIIMVEDSQTEELDVDARLGLNGGARVIIKDLKAGTQVQYDNCISHNDGAGNVTFQAYGFDPETNFVEELARLVFEHEGWRVEGRFYYPEFGVYELGDAKGTPYVKAYKSNEKWISIRAHIEGYEIHHPDLFKKKWNYWKPTDDPYADTWGYKRFDGKKDQFATFFVNAKVTRHAHGIPVMELADKQPFVPPGIKAKDWPIGTKVVLRFKMRNATYDNFNTHYEDMFEVTGLKVHREGVIK